MRTLIFVFICLAVICVKGLTTTQQTIPQLDRTRRSSPEDVNKQSLLVQTQAEIKEMGDRLKSMRLGSGNIDAIKALSRQLEEKNSVYDKLYHELKEAGFQPADLIVKKKLGSVTNKIPVHELQMFSHREKEIADITKDIEAHRSKGEDDAAKQLTKLLKDKKDEYSRAKDSLERKYNGKSQENEFTSNSRNGDNLFSYMAAKAPKKDRKSKVVEDVLRIRREIEELHDKYNDISSADDHALANELRASIDQRIEEHKNLVNANPSLIPIINEAHTTKLTKSKKERFDEIVATLSPPDSSAKDTKQHKHDIMSAAGNYFLSAKRAIESNANNMYSMVSHLETDKLTGLAIDEKTRTELKDSIAEMMELQLDALYEEADIEDQRHEIRGLTHESMFGSATARSKQSNKKFVDTESKEFKDRLQTLADRSREHHTNKDAVQQKAHELRMRIDTYAFGRPNQMNQ